MSNTKQTKPKRLLSLLLTLAMVLGMLPAMSMTAFAYSGTGTENNPYIVTDYDELLELMKNTPYNTTRYIKLGSDISYSGSINGHALGLENDFQSVDLDLNGYTVSRSGTTTDTAPKAAPKHPTNDTTTSRFASLNLQFGRNYDPTSRK